MSILEWISRRFDRWLPVRRVVIVNDHVLPKDMPIRSVVVAQPDGEDWFVGMRCPCGCGTSIELSLLPDIRPRWRLEIDTRGRPTLKPSVWLQKGCRSHFWICGGHIDWCQPS